MVVVVAIVGNKQTISHASFEGGIGGGCWASRGCWLNLEEVRRHGVGPGPRSGINGPGSGGPSRRPSSCGPRLLVLYNIRYHIKYYISVDG